MFNPFTKKVIKPLENKPALVRMGGKRYLSKRICQKINNIEHSLYIEPFFGGGRIFFEKAPEFMSIINDIESRIANFNYVIKNFPQEFHAYQIQLIKDENTFLYLYDLYNDPYYLKKLQDNLRRSKKLWERYNDYDSKIFMVNCASNYYFFCNMAFRGSRTARTMTYPENDPGTEKNRLRWRIFREVRWMKDRMRNTTVLSQDFERVVKQGLRYDNHIKLFYFDPPFLETEGYENPFFWEDYERLKSCLEQIKAPDYFILSLNDKKRLRKLFNKFKIDRKPTHYSTGGNGQRKKVFELLITPKWEPMRKRTNLTKFMEAK